MSLSPDDERRIKLVWNVAATATALLTLISGPAWQWHWRWRFAIAVLWALGFGGSLLSLASWGSRDMDVSPGEWWRVGRERMLGPIRLRSQGRGVERLRVIVDVPLAFGGLGLLWIAARAINLWRRLRRCSRRSSGIPIGSYGRDDVVT
jgi:hypothetical protein